jgi:cytochrome c oxidase subunit 2
MLVMGLVLLSVASLSTVAQDPKDTGMPTPRVHEIQVALKKYEFSPSTLRVKRGERVRLTLAALDHDHGFKLEEFDINHKVEKGRTATVEFTADKVGRFQFRCSNVCGLGHRGMKGTLIVEE